MLSEVGLGCPVGKNREMLGSRACAGDNDWRLAEPAGGDLVLVGWVHPALPPMRVHVLQVSWQSIGVVQA